MNRTISAIILLVSTHAYAQQTATYKQGEQIIYQDGIKQYHLLTVKRVTRDPYYGTSYIIDQNEKSYEIDYPLGKLIKLYNHIDLKNVPNFSEHASEKVFPVKSGDEFISPSMTHDPLSNEKNQDYKLHKVSKVFISNFTDVWDPMILTDEGQVIEYMEFDYAKTIPEFKGIHQGSSVEICSVLAGINGPEVITVDKIVPDNQCLPEKDPCPGKYAFLYTKEGNVYHSFYLCSNEQHPYQESVYKPNGQKVIKP